MRLGQSTRTSVCENLSKPQVDAGGGPGFAPVTAELATHASSQGGQLLTAQSQSPFGAGRGRLPNLRADLARHMKHIGDFAEHGANFIRRAPAVVAGASLVAVRLVAVRLVAGGIAAGGL